MSLHDLVDPGSILRLYGASREDIELMAAVEEEMKRLHPEGKERCTPAKREKCQAEFGEFLEWACSKCEINQDRG